MRSITHVPSVKASLGDYALGANSELAAWLTIEITDAFAQRQAMDAIWTNALRQYNCSPRNPIRNVPIENAPNIEVPLGAIGADSIYAQMIDLIWNISPTITVTATNAQYIDHQKAFQRWCEYVAVNELNLRAASEHMGLDDVLLGTGFYYVPWTERIKKNDRVVTLTRGPECFAVPPEDVIVPGGSMSIMENLRFVGLRFWYSMAELKLEADQSKWDISGVQRCGNISQLRMERERLAKTASSGKRLGDLYEIIVLRVLYDIDDDGIAEDLYVVWDRTSRNILFLDYYPYDRLPITKSVYQVRSHMVHGMGVMEMMTQLQDAATDILNYWMCNMLLANARMWKGPPGQLPMPFTVWPGKFVELSDPDSLKGEALADVYNSGPQAFAMMLSLAERRTGTNDMTLPRPSQVLGSRTPATTAMTMFQQINRRFTPAFDQFRLATAGAVMQAMYRYQERILARDSQTLEHVISVMGPEDGPKVVFILQDVNFSESMKVEMTASSATVNREVERQNSMFLVGLLSQYYEKTVQLTTLAANPQLPQPVRDVAMKIAKASGEIIERTIRTFDQIRDPSAFIVNVEEEIDQLGQQADVQQQLMPLLQILNGAGGQGGIQTPVT